MEYLFIGLGGIVGALSRYGLTKLVAQRWQSRFPIATFCINIIGSFFLGLFYGMFPETDKNWFYLKYLVMIGFLGAFTTYSTFSYEIIGLIKEKEHLITVIYVLASIVMGLIAAYTGIMLAG